ncbi:hypothetical protein RA263_27600, partial [Pseudomonas syringae pv. tagetis]
MGVVGVVVGLVFVGGFGVVVLCFVGVLFLLGFFVLFDGFGLLGLVVGFFCFSLLLGIAAGAAMELG